MSYGFSEAMAARPDRAPTPGSEVGVQPLVDHTRLDGDTDEDRRIQAAHRLYEHLIGLWAPGVIEAAHDLGMFAELAKGAASAVEVAETLKTDERATRIMLDALHAYAMVDAVVPPDGITRYVLGERMLPSVLPGGVYSLTGKMDYDRAVAWPAWRSLAEAVRHGSRDAAGHDRANQISETDYESLALGINFWAPPIVARLHDWLDASGWDAGVPARVLDVGCGSGLYGQLMLRRRENWHVTGVDAPRIIELARAQARRLGVDGRFSGMVGDFWADAWGAGFDLVFFANIFHLQTPESAAKLTATAAGSLSERGLICIADHIVDDTGRGESEQDRFARLFAASMLATGGGDAYRLSRYDRWLESAGLRRVALIDAPMHRILIATRPDNTF
ncbi:methyltransferase domain-containing protein [Sphaerisporangium rhizosphaerae]|uniref:Methyltransferase domain-containing protein n=1 Tax=Sphaerisporangium rhizosphaerae TaxID=2269375 RepID=A0ABW2P2S2_9ACTN